MVAVGGVVLHFRAAESVGGRVLLASEGVVAGIAGDAVSADNVDAVSADNMAEGGRAGEC
jgi:hypothetical protein